MILNTVKTVKYDVLHRVLIMNLQLTRFFREVSFFTMFRYQSILLIFVSFILSIALVVSSAASQQQQTPIGIQHLLKAYPTHLESATANTLYWKDGTDMLYDDVKNKEFQMLLNFPDLEDQMSIPYVAGRNYQIPRKNFDPGRIRYEPFFLKMYGKSASQVKRKLVSISWMPKTVNKRIMVTSVNGVNEKLQAVSNELDALPYHLKKYVTKTAGTFNWRKISSTNRLSVHSFGIAIDINIKYANYWRWNMPKNPHQELKYRNSIPMEIVEIFEKHGFIWGGKWYHYDTMHFEYRPELLINRK